MPTWFVTGASRGLGAETRPPWPSAAPTACPRTCKGPELIPVVAAVESLVERTVAQSSTAGAQQHGRRHW
jgi:hypothetical protein